MFNDNDSSCGVFRDSFGYLKDVFVCDSIVFLGSCQGSYLHTCQSSLFTTGSKSNKSAYESSEVHSLLLVQLCCRHRNDVSIPVLAQKQKVNKPNNIFFYNRFKFKTDLTMEIRIIKYHN